MASTYEDSFKELIRLGLTPAMITALFQKPHDRQFVVELENSVASFVDSNAESYELRPMNSYYRLLSHQVAEYHNLKHALARAHDSCVIIFKGDGFRKLQGKPLLQALQPVILASDGFSNNNTSNNSNNTKRYRILKRNDGELPSNSNVDNTNEHEGRSRIEEQEDDNGNDGDSNANVSLEQQRLEKEKQYEQRKQEIFSTPKESSDDDNNTNNNNTKNINDDDDDDDARNNDTENAALENTSPQPYQFETSRYRINNDTTTGHENEQHLKFDSHHQHDRHDNPFYGNGNGHANGYNNGSGYGNGNARRSRKRNSFYNDSRRSSSSATPQYHLPYWMYPTPPMPVANTSQPPPQFPIMYPAPFPLDGTNGYMAPYMYQPISGFGPMGPKGNITSPSPPPPPPYMTFPFPYQYGQIPPPPPPSSSMYRQFPAPYRSHGPKYQRNSRNSSRSSFSRRSTDRRDSQDDTVEGRSSTSTMASATTEIDEVTENMQKLPI